MSGGRVFNALNGAEVKAKILKEIKDALDGDNRFAQHVAFPVVSWGWRLNLEQYPSEPAKIDLEVQRRITDPPVPRTLTVERTEPVVQGHPPSLVAESIASRDTVAQEVRADPKIAALEAMVQKMSQQIAAMAIGAPIGTDDPRSREEIDADNLRDAARRPSPSPLGTKAGVIVGGAKPSPGAHIGNSYGGSAVGVVSAIETEHRNLIEIAGPVHDPVEQGGVGAPDRIRREAGLPVPTPTTVPGVGIVDLTGTF